MITGQPFDPRDIIDFWQRQTANLLITTNITSHGNEIFTLNRRYLFEPSSVAFN
jgi:hypothetical protein